MAGGSISSRRPVRGHKCPQRYNRLSSGPTFGIHNLNYCMNLSDMVTIKGNSRVSNVVYFKQSRNKEVFIYKTLPHNLYKIFRDNKSAWWFVGKQKIAG